MLLEKGYTVLWERSYAALNLWLLERQVVESL